ncbi:glycoside hydrolase family 32 protein [Catenovulum agarivorans]|uniref:glycoside hydrolase family 32 protein n=1 Tax=Catenovulum agarivorans TaxID=1172192 RepID=UPI0002DAA9E4|nr:glycoside hydrolase family 32 protein [Catenovulum agarivorans]
MKFVYPLIAAGMLAACSQSNLDSMSQSPTLSGDNLVKAANTFHYQDHHRPQFHFTPQANWMNDPNGMVYHNGEYHLFFQYYPEATVWGPMHWGHAVSKDLVHWQELPIALYPDQHGWIFSGSAVADVNNTSGLGTKDNPPLIAIYTYHNEAERLAGSKNFQTQGIAYSLDDGRSWTPYAGNPVLIGPDIPDFRDPKVAWYAPENKWIMTLAVDDHISFYSSPNLKEWKFESDFGIDAGTHGGVWECPDLLKMPVEGSDEEKYVLLVSINPGGPNGGSATQYFVGDFDGNKFTLDDKFKQDVSKIPSQFPDGLVFADFETDFSDWTLTGTAFSAGPVAGNYPNQGGVGNYIGKRLVNSFYKGDAATGAMTSKTFTVEQPFINFYVGGGMHPGKTAVNLLVKGEVVRTATGPNNERLEIASWDVSELLGQQAQIEIVDRVSGGWGHINVDHIVFADKAAHPDIEPAVWLDYGTDNYAGVTWSNVPEEDGRFLFIGWMSNWLYANNTPTDRWRSATTIPRELRLYQAEAGYRVRSVPIDELDKLRAQSFSAENTLVYGSANLSALAKISSAQFELNATVDAQSAEQFSIDIGNAVGEKVSIKFDRNNNQLVLDRTQSGKSRFHGSFASEQFAPLDGAAQQYQITLYQDASSTELFVNNGEIVMTALVFPNQDYQQVTINAEQEIKLTDWSLHQLQSIWK